MGACRKLSLFLQTNFFGIRHSTVTGKKSYWERLTRKLISADILYFDDHEYIQRWFFWVCSGDKGIWNFWDNALRVWHFGGYTIQYKVAKALIIQSTCIKVAHFVVFPQNWPFDLNIAWNCSPRPVLAPLVYCVFVRFNIRSWPLNVQAGAEISNPCRRWAQLW